MFLVFIKEYKINYFLNELVKIILICYSKKMGEEITTLGIQNKGRNIATEFVKFVNSNKEFHDNNKELMLLLNKINSNIQAIMLLNSRMLFSESKIILRSAFESTILFIYLVDFPQELIRYKEDNLITEIKTIYICYKHNNATLKDVINCYKRYKEKFQLNISLFEVILDKNDITTQEKELEKFFKNFKPLSQQVRFMLNKLKKSKHFLANHLSLLQFEMYNINSEFTHSRLDTLFLNLGNFSTDETLKELQTNFKQVAGLYHTIIETLTYECRYENPQRLCQLILETMMYLKINY